MSSNIDERVVQMQFDNAQFEKGIEISMKSLDALKEKLNLDESTRQISGSVDKITNSTDDIAKAFNSLGGRIKLAIFDKIANKIADTAESITKTLTIGLPKAGFEKYNQKNQGVQTILNAVEDQYESREKALEAVNEALSDLNKYTDETSYDFTDMVSNIGKFTSAGVDLKDSVIAMEGIANAAALSGGGINEASRAMYNFSQALSAGYVKLIDWKSIENANMATKEFKNQIIDTAIELGRLQVASDGTAYTMEGNAVDYQNFSQTLKDAWFDSDVLISVLGKFGDTTTEIGLKSYKAAQQAVTFRQAVDAIKDSVSSGWMKTFELIFGNLQESIDLWTGFCNGIIEVTSLMDELRNSIFETWSTEKVFEDEAPNSDLRMKEYTGREAALEGLADIAQGLIGIFQSLHEAFENVFAGAFTEDLFAISEGLKNFGTNFKRVLGIVDTNVVHTEKTLTYGKEFLGTLKRDKTADKAKKQELDTDKSRKATVKNLQEMLKAAGYYEGEITGVYDNSTVQAVVAVQKRHKLIQDGKFDLEVYNKLVDEYFAKTSKVGKRTGAEYVNTEKLSKELKAGGAFETGISRSLKLTEEGKNDTVKFLQEMLKEVGYYEGKITGVYDDSTIKAVRAFQKSNDLVETGTVMLSTYNKISEQYQSKMNEKLGPTETDTKAYEKILKNADALKKGGVFERGISRSTVTSATAELQEETEEQRELQVQAVKEMQQMLKDAGYYEGKITGKFDESSENAIKAFQEANKLNATGIFDEETYKSLSKAPRALNKELKRGNKNDKEAVKELQSLLVKEGILEEKDVDGIFGKNTEAALKKFQEANNLEPTGVLDAETWKKLGPGMVNATEETDTYTESVMKLTGILDNFKRALTGAFTIVKFGGTILKFAFSIAVKILSVLEPILTTFFDVLGVVGDFITMMFGGEVAENSPLYKLLGLLLDKILVPVVDAIAKATEAVRRFFGLTDEFKTENPQLSQFQKIMQKISDTLTKIWTPIQNVLVSIFGIGEASEKADGELTGFQKVVESIKSTFSTIWGSIENFVRSILGISDAVDESGEKVSVFETIVDKIGSALTWLSENVVSKVIASLPNIFEWINGAFTNIVNFAMPIIDKLGKVLNGIGGFFSSMIETAKEDPKVKMAIKRIRGLFTGKYSVGQVFSAIGAAIKSLFNWDGLDKINWNEMNPFQKVLKFLKDVFDPSDKTKTEQATKQILGTGSTYDKLVFAFQSIKKTITNAIDKIRKLFKGEIKFSDVIASIGKFFTNLWNGIRDYFTSKWKSVDKMKPEDMNIIDKVIKFLKDIFDPAESKSSTDDAVPDEGETQSWITRVINSVINWFKGLWDSIVTWFKTLRDAPYQKDPDSLNLFERAIKWFRDIFDPPHKDPSDPSSTMPDKWGWIKRLYTALSTWISGLWTSVTTIFKQAWDNADKKDVSEMNLFERAIKWIHDIFNPPDKEDPDVSGALPSEGEQTTFVGKVLKAVGDWISNLWKTITTRVKNLWSGNYDENDLNLFDKAILWIKGIFNSNPKETPESTKPDEASTTSFISKIFDTVKGWISSIWTAITNFFKEQWDLISDKDMGELNVFEKIIRFIHDIFAPKENVKSEAVPEDEMSKYDEIVVKIRGLIDKVKGVKDEIQAIIDKFRTMWDEVDTKDESELSIFERVIKWIKGLVDSGDSDEGTDDLSLFQRIATAITTIVDKVIEIWGLIKDKVLSLYDKIKNSNTITDFFSSIIDWFKTFFSKKDSNADSGKTSSESKEEKKNIKDIVENIRGIIGFLMAAIIGIAAVVVVLRLTKPPDVKSLWENITEFLESIAHVLEVISALIVVFGSMKPEAFKQAMTGIGIIMGALLVFSLALAAGLGIIKKKLDINPADLGALVGIVAAIGLLAAISVALSFVSWGMLLSGLAKASVVMVPLLLFVAAIGLIVKWTGKNINIGEFKGFLGLVAAIGLMVLVVAAISLLVKIAGTGRIFGAMGIILALEVLLLAFVAGIALINKKLNGGKNMEGIMKGLGALIGVAAAIGILAAIVFVFALLPTRMLIQGVAGVGALLLALGAMIWLSANALKKGSKGIVGLIFVVMSVAAVLGVVYLLITQTKDINSSNLLSLGVIIGAVAVLMASVALMLGVVGKVKLDWKTLLSVAAIIAMISVLLLAIGALLSKVPNLSPQQFEGLAKVLLSVFAGIAGIILIISGVGVLVAKLDIGNAMMAGLAKVAVAIGLFFSILIAFALLIIYSISELNKNGDLSKRLENVGQVLRKIGEAIAAPIAGVRDVLFAGTSEDPQALEKTAFATIVTLLGDDILTIAEKCATILENSTVLQTIDPDLLDSVGETLKKIGGVIAAPIVGVRDALFAVSETDADDDPEKRALGETVLSSVITYFGADILQIMSACAQMISQGDFSDIDTDTMQAAADNLKLIGGVIAAPIVGVRDALFGAASAKDGEDAEKEETGKTILAAVITGFGTKILDIADACAEMVTGDSTLATVDTATLQSAADKLTLIGGVIAAPIVGVRDALFSVADSGATDAEGNEDPKVALGQTILSTVITFFGERILKIGEACAEIINNSSPLETLSTPKLSAIGGKLEKIGACIAAPIVGVRNALFNAGDSGAADENGNEDPKVQMGENILATVVTLFGERIVKIAEACAEILNNSSSLETISTPKLSAIGGKLEKIGNVIAAPISGVRSAIDASSQIAELDKEAEGTELAQNGSGTSSGLASLLTAFGPLIIDIATSAADLITKLGSDETFNPDELSKGGERLNAIGSAIGQIVGGIKAGALTGQMKSFSEAADGLSSEDSTFEEDTATMVTAMTSIAGFMESLGALDIEQNTGAFAGWFSDKTKAQTFFENLNSMGTGITRFKTSVAGLAKANVSEDATAAVTALETMSKFISRVSSGEFNFQNKRVGTGESDIWGNEITEESNLTKFQTNIDQIKEIITDLSNSLKNVNLEKFTLAGEGLANLANGISTIQNTTIDAETISSNANSAISSASNGMADADTSGAAKAGENMLASALNSLASAKSKFQIVGANCVQGFFNGFDFNKWKATEAGKMIASKALEAAKEELKQHSPSRKFMEVGKFSAIGLANGIDKFAKVVVKAGADMGENAYESTSKVLTKLGGMAFDDIDADPVIRPVVDMTNVSHSANVINSMLSSNRTIGLSTTGNLAGSVANQKKGQNGSSNSNNSNLTQNQTSSVNLSGNNFYVREENDIYRIANEIGALTSRQQRSLGETT